MRILVILAVFCSVLTASIRCHSVSVYLEDPSWIVDAEKNYNNKSKYPEGIENRVMFDEDIAWALSKSNTDKIINHLAMAGFNVYIPCVWHGNGTHYPSTIAFANPQVLERIKRGDDPLAYLIKKAHEKNIEVHAWFTVMRRETDNYKDFYDRYSPQDAFDVQNPKFREFIISLVTEAVTKYNIDGLNLDYIRSMGYCTSEKCAKEYQEKTSRNLTADLFLEKVPKSRIKSIEVWNEEPVENIVKTISEKARKIRPNIMISVDSMPGARHLRMQGHDSQKWLNNKWIDTIFFMAYENDFKIENVELAKSKVENPDAIILITSLYDMERPTLEKKPGALLRKTILAGRKVWPNSGFAFYHYKQMSDNQIKELRSTVYAKPARSTWSKCESKSCFSKETENQKTSVVFFPAPSTVPKCESEKCS